MVGCNVSYLRHTVLCHAVVCIVVMKVRDPSLLALAAAVFAYVMACSSGRCECDINRDARIAELPCHVCRDIMHSGNVSEGIEGRDLCSEAHEFIYEIDPDQSVHPYIFRCAPL